MFSHKHPVPEYQVVLHGFSSEADLRKNGFDTQKTEETVREMSYIEKVLQMHYIAIQMKLPLKDWFTGERKQPYWESQTGYKFSGKCKINLLALLQLIHFS